MNLKLTSLVLAAVAAFGTQAVLAADAKPAAKKGADCYEAQTAPAAKSDKSREEVKKEAKGASTECEASKAPDAKSSAARADVKAEAKRAAKAGEVPQGEAMEKPKK